LLFIPSFCSSLKKTPRNHILRTYCHCRCVTRPCGSSSAQPCRWSVLPCGYYTVGSAVQADFGAQTQICVQCWQWGQ